MDCRHLKVFFRILLLGLSCLGVAMSAAPVPPPAHDGAVPQDPGPPLMRRLTRFEYDRTIRDLVGIDFDSQAAVGMPDDDHAQGFDNQAAALNIPPALMDKYLDAADKILDRVLAGPNGKVSESGGDRQKVQKAHDALIFADPDKAASPRAAAQQILAQFARRAYRRSVSAHEVDPLLRLYDLGERRGAPFEEALRPALKAVLVSPYFLFRIETNRSGAPAGGVYPVDDYALATRLSYFLWSSMPDPELFDLAEKKKLSDSMALEQQARRMLADPRARALTDNFAAQWLQLRKLALARPSTDFFPTFTDSLRQAMYDETATFFDNLRVEDKSLLNLLDADYTYLNEDLARNYNIAGVTGNNLRLVKLKPEDHRGGLLGMGSILAMTSHTYRTSPTLRGKWVLDVIFGTPPPPPPPGVSVIVDEQKQQTAGATFRELLARHASQPACAGCHRQMDPLGYALENYDAIGRWRTDQGGRPLDASAQLPTGEKLNGAQELKQQILKRKDAFVRNLTEQMLAYALGREPIAADAPTVDQIVGDLQQNDCRFSVLVTGIVKSYPFHYRRADAIAPRK